MNKISIIIICLISYAKIFAQQNDWQLPQKDGVIFFEHSKSFKVADKEVCTYISNQSIFSEINSIANTKAIELAKSTKTKGNFRIISTFSGVDIDMHDPKTFYLRCDPNKNDTSIGKIDIYFPLSSEQLDGLEMIPYMVECKFRIVFIDNDKYTLTLKGFKVKGNKLDKRKRDANSIEAFLDDTYSDYIKTNKKDKKTEQFFSTLPKLMSIFFNSIDESIEKSIKYSSF